MKLKVQILILNWYTYQFIPPSSSYILLEFKFLFGINFVVNFSQQNYYSTLEIFSYG